MSPLTCFFSRVRDILVSHSYGPKFGQIAGNMIFGHLSNLFIQKDINE